MKTVDPYIRSRNAEKEKFLEIFFVGSWVLHTSVRSNDKSPGVCFAFPITHKGQNDQRIYLKVLNNFTLILIINFTGEILAEMLIVKELIKKLPTFDETGKFVAVFTRAQGYGLHFITCWFTC
jgi:hypothetical protein